VRSIAISEGAVEREESEMERGGEKYSESIRIIKGMLMNVICPIASLLVQLLHVHQNLATNQVNHSSHPSPLSSVFSFSFLF
jgi:hypothetical protein